MRPLAATDERERAPEDASAKRPEGPVRRLVHSLYPEVPHRPVTLRRGLAAVAAVVAGMALSLSRTGGAGALNSTWIEDAKQFLTAALTQQLPDPVLTPFSGYLHVGPRLLTEIAVLFPVRWAAPVQTLLAVGMLAVFASVAYLGSGAYFTKVWQRLVLSAPVMMMPVGHTQADNDVATLQFPSLYAMFWLLLWRPSSRVAKVGAVLLAAYITSSSVLAIALVPLLVIRLFAVRDWATRAIALGYASGAGLELFYQVTGRATRNGIGHPTSDVVWLLHAYVTRAVPRSIFGEVWLGGPGTDYTGAPIPLNTPNPALHVALIGSAWVIVLAAVVLALLRFTRPHWPLAVLAGGASVSLFVFQVANMGTVQPRYVIASGLLLYVMLAALLRPREREASVPRSQRLLTVAPLLVLALVLATACAANWRVDNGRARSLAWDQIIAQGREACADQHVATYSYWYTWWYVYIPCSKLR